MNFAKSITPLNCECIITKRVVKVNRGNVKNNYKNITHKNTELLSVLLLFCLFLGFFGLSRVACFVTAGLLVSRLICLLNF